MALTRMEIPQVVKEKVRTVLMSKKTGMTIGEFFNRYRRHFDEPLDLKQMGLPRMEDFIAAIPDVARLERNENGVRIFAVPQSKQGTKDGGQMSTSHARNTVRNGIERNSEHYFASASETDEMDLQPDDRGHFSVCFPAKKKPAEALKPLFEQAGPVAEVHEAKMFIFVRYTNCQSALKAIQMFPHLNIQPGRNKKLTLAPKSVENKHGEENSKVKVSDDFVQDIWRPEQQITSPYRDQMKEIINGVGGVMASPMKRSESPSPKEKTLKESPSGHKEGPRTGMEVYIGNIASVATQKDLYDLLSKRHRVMKIDLKQKGVNTFAFVGMRSEEELDAVVQEFNNMDWHGHRLVVRKQHKKSKNKNSPSPTKDHIKKFSPGDQKKRSFDQISPITSMPPLESDMPELETDIPYLEGNFPYALPELETDMPKLKESSVAGSSESCKGQEKKQLIIVENFPDETSERELIALFYRYHPVKATITPNKGCNTAEIQLTSPEDIDKAVDEMNQQVYMDRTLCVSRPPPEVEKDEEISFGELLNLRGFIIKQLAQPPLQVQLGQRLEVFVTSVISNNIFWGQVINPKFEAKLAEISKTINNPSSRLARNGRYGRCVASFDADGLWYRAWVFKELQDSKKVQVFFMDYGNSSTVAVDKIAFCTSKDIWGLCALAVPFTLTEPVLNLKERELTHITVEVVALGSEGEEGRFFIAKPISLTGMDQILVATAAVRQLTLRRGDNPAS